MIVYLVKPSLLQEDRAAVKEQWASSVDGHAGENETSQMLVIRPDLVDLPAMVDDEEGHPLNRLKELGAAGLYTGIWWYADHPSHYRGEAVYASAEKGDHFLAARTRALVEAIRVVKSDNISRRLQDEFFAASSVPSAYPSSTAPARENGQKP